MWIGRESCAALTVRHQCGLGSVLEFQVYGCPVGETQSAKHLHRLVVLENLHSTHVVVVDAFGGNPVFASEQVVALDVEFVDVLTLVFDLTLVVNIDAGHAVEHIAYIAVLFPGKRSDVVSYGVAVLSDTLRFHGHFFQLESLQGHDYFERHSSAVEFHRLLGVTDHAYLDGAALCGRSLDGEQPFS